MLVGNHDSVNKKNNKINLLEVFKSYAKVYEDYSLVENGKYALHFLPYFDEEQTIKKIKEIKLITNKKNYYFGHCGVNGFKYQIDGYTDPQNNITRDLFEKFDQVILGHFHSYQEMGNIFYVSSPLQSKHGDETGKHGFVFINTDTNEKEFVENIYSPNFITIELNKKNMDKISLLEKHFIRLVVKKKINSDVLSRFKEKLLIKNYKVDFIFEYKNLDNNLISVEGWDEIVYNDAEDIITSYLDKIGDDLPYKKEDLLKILND